MPINKEKLELRDKDAKKSEKKKPLKTAKEKKLAKRMKRDGKE